MEMDAVGYRTEMAMIGGELLANQVTKAIVIVKINKLIAEP